MSSYYFGGFNYAVWTIRENGKQEVELFQRESEAVKHAKFMLYNAKRVEVLSITGSSFSGKAIWASKETKKKLVQVKEQK